MQTKLGAGPEGPFYIDVSKLVETRLLIQANSGGGKSYIVRKLLEMTFGKIQHIVLDMEGDFATLREKYNYILAGEDGDIPAHPGSAAMMARKVLELKTSIIVDLFELKHEDRFRFVKIFLEAMINAKKSLWHPVLVLLDEAHVFAPETTKADSTGAVVEMASRGRKRGFCLVPATQRLAKLSKDVAAECNNKMIGRTGLDRDMKRAYDELGFTTKEQLISLRQLDPGQFFAFGPALSKAVEKVKIGKVVTTHPDASKGIKSYTPAATSKVKSVLSKLKDLPQKAQEEAKTLNEAKTRIRDLERQVRNAPTKTDEKEIERAFQRGLSQGGAGKDEYLKTFKKAISLVRVTSADLKKLQDLFGEVPKEKPSPQIIEAVSRPREPAKIDIKETPEDGTLSKCERAILGFLISYPGREFSKAQVGVMAGYRQTSGTFKSAIAHLNTLGLLERQGTHIASTPAGEGVGVVPGFEGIGSWEKRLNKCERTIFQILGRYETEVSKDEIARVAEYRQTSGTFKSAIARLNTLGLIKRNGNGTLIINPEISNL